MKKILLTFGVMALAFGANAEELVNLIPAESSTFEDTVVGEGNLIGGWYSWGNDSSRGLADEGYNSDHSLMLVNPTSADTYSAQAAYDIDLVNGETYVVSFWAKSSVADGTLQFAYQMSESPYTGGGYTEFAVGTDWTYCEKEFTVSQDDMTRILINFGAVAATYYVDDIVLASVSGEGGTPSTPGNSIPDDVAVLAFGDQTDGETFVAWSETFDNTTVNGTEAVVYTNATAGDSYTQQLAIDLNYAEGDTYYISFDVMGDPSDVAISAWFQNKADYSTVGGYSTFNSFQVTSDTEWTNVVLVGSYQDENATADRVVINLGEYVGTLYMTNFVVYGPASANEPGDDQPGDDEPGDDQPGDDQPGDDQPGDEPDDAGVESLYGTTDNGIVVYNLMGVKVLESSDAANLNTLHPGIYVVNGKKVVVK